MLIREIVLENFMSYEYGRIPLKPGLNIICGPNGSGKSSILLGMAVALGQTYTERSRRLSDLIRWGEDIARVTIVFDNSPVSGKRPYPRIRTDTIRLSRYLRRDGSYWFELNRREVTKSEVQSFLREIGINPDNMLIIMHQNMVEEFAFTTPQRKLEMVEDAVGFSQYRADLMDAEKRLKKILSEEEALKSVMKDAEETLAYWQKEYEKYLKKVEYERKLSELRRELFWAKVARYEKNLGELRSDLHRHKALVEEIDSQLENIRLELSDIEELISQLKEDYKRLFYTLIEYERDKEKILLLQILLNEVKLDQDFNQLVRVLKIPPNISEIDSITRKISKLHIQISSTEAKLDKALKEYVELKVKDSLLKYRQELLREKISELKRKIKSEESELKKLILQAENYGSRVEITRALSEISEDIRVTEAKIAMLGDISSDAERMFNLYRSTYSELEEKIRQLEQNKQRVLSELEERRRVWKNAIQKLIDDINPIYQEVLSRINAIGRIRLINLESLENAGLEILIGFRGHEPKILDGHTQSGGERSASIIAFLIALQKFIKSPIRAVDEFDVHMDPANREAILSTIISMFSSSNSVQHIVITPSPVTTSSSGINAIIVQNIAGRSEVSALAESQVEQNS